MSDSKKFKWKSIRLKEFDYTQAYWYFVTINVYKHQKLFGEIIEGKVKLNSFGKIALKYWKEIPEHFENSEFDYFVIMPTHMHGIVVPGGTSTACRADTSESFGKPVPGSLPTIIRSYKSAVTKRINELRSTPGKYVWQRNYYERVIRNEKELYNIRKYILQNPQKWQFEKNKMENLDL